MIGLSWCSGDPKHCAVGHSNISGDFFDVIIIIIIKPLLKSKLTVTTRYNHDTHTKQAATQDSRGGPRNSPRGRRSLR